MNLKEIMSFMNRPFSPAADRNKTSILDVLKRYLINPGNLLEVGSGTAQHAVYMAQNLAHINWYTSDQDPYHQGINLCIDEHKDEHKLENLFRPISFKIGVDQFPSFIHFNYVFSANTLHIMSWDECQELFSLLGESLVNGALVFFYGPFNYNGKFTSVSNSEFDKTLKLNDPGSGIRDFEKVCDSLQSVGITLIEDCPMPANNRTLIFRKSSS